MAKYIYEHKNWTSFSLQDQAINVVFGEVRHMQGVIIGQMNAFGLSSFTRLMTEMAELAEP